jgi:preprotein translocase subunit SecE
MAEKTSPAEFIQEVRDEARKVTWPSRSELMVSTVMVLSFVVIASIFFLIVDFFLSWGVDRVLFGL